ncbi:fructose-bisphosphate aldolase class 1 [Striga asiatica]|uniref:Fructose-bisphosphate aldolase class 1 n=1 Tax=Striga asiatica TaxID=4170 RepID=A0A5A7QK57_STRAF|nr:fructose-bisphosphate aldolase class 1 [Striga asiatica]
MSNPRNNVKLVTFSREGQVALRNRSTFPPTGPVVAELKRDGVGGLLIPGRETHPLWPHVNNHTLGLDYVRRVTRAGVDHVGEGPGERAIGRQLRDHHDLGLRVSQAAQKRDVLIHCNVVDQTGIHRLVRVQLAGPHCVGTGRTLFLVENRYAVVVDEVGGGHHSRFHSRCRPLGV